MIVKVKAKKAPKKMSTSEKLMTSEEQPYEGLDEVAKPPRNVKKVLYIARHGKTALDPTNRSDGWLDLPLSDEGRVRLITLQQYLKDIPLTHVIAPDFLRTLESANIVASGTISRPKVVVASDDAKTWNLGVFAGTEKKPNKPKVQRFMDNPEKVPEGGESHGDFCQRFFAWFDKIMAKIKAGKGPMLLVLSGSNIRALSERYTGDKETWELDEGGLLELMPSGEDVKGKVLFGAKDQDNDWLS